MGFLVSLALLWIVGSVVVSFKNAKGGQISLDDVKNNLDWPVDLYKLVKAKFTKK